jgi:hypothetical protein
MSSRCFSNARRGRRRETTRKGPKIEQRRRAGNIQPRPLTFESVVVGVEAAERAPRRRLQNDGSDWSFCCSFVTREGKRRQSSSTSIIEWRRFNEQIFPPPNTQLMAADRQRLCRLEKDVVRLLSSAEVDILLHRDRIREISPWISRPKTFLPSRRRTLPAHVET